MKNIKISAFMAAIAAVAATGCTSYEIDMPSNPDQPVVGKEVPTDVIYQANPRFFADNNCLAALNQHVDRISGMGNDILWIMPVCEMGELNAIGSPYCIRDFKAMNPKYGTIDDLKTLVENAHSKGMKVILDWIANHTSWDCAWITEHPDWYVYDADGNIVSPESWTDVAQLDYSNPEVAAAMKDAMLYWFNEADIDGFRCDYAHGVPQAFWSDVIADLRAIDPDVIMLAETNISEFYDCGFDMMYDWDSSTTIAAALTGGKPNTVTAEATKALANVPDGKSILRFAFNHDVAATNNVDTMFGTPEGAPAAYVLASMLNGTPMIYSSMDVEGLIGRQSFFDYNPLTFSDALTDRYKAINSAFKASAEVRRGQLDDYSNSSVVCFTRSIPGHTLLVTVNATNSEQTIKTPIQLAGKTMKDLISGSDVTVPVTVTLPAYGYIIYMD